MPQAKVFPHTAGAEYGGAFLAALTSLFNKFNLEWDFHSV